MQHPLLFSNRRLGYYALAWIVLIMIQALIIGFRFSFSWTIATTDAMVFLGFYGFIALSFWYPARYISLENRQPIVIFWNHLLAAVTATVIWIGGAVSLLRLLSVDSFAYLSFLEASLLWRALFGILIYFVAVSFYYLSIYFHNLQERQLREAELRSLVQEAELKTLKFQINPHFIFNSLNSINSLIASDPQRSSTMVVKLADFLRSTLASNDIQLKPLKAEIETARLYLDIEKTRFADRLLYEETIAEDTLEAEVPSMILQPLFENAIKHGVYESLEPVMIRLESRIDQPYLVILMENDFDPSSSKHAGEGIGLKNIAERLERLYRQPDLLEIKAEEGHFSVALHIPLNGDRP